MPGAKPVLRHRPARLSPVTKAGRKGRISNELVAASCAAILSVYAAGFWRTRDAAGRFESEGQTRPPVRPAPVPTVTPAAAAPALVTVATSELVAAAEPQSASDRQLAVKKSLKVDSAPPTPTIASVTVEVKPEPVPAAEPEPDATVVADEAEPPAPAHKPWLDGYYTGWGTSRHGDIKAFVTIKDGMIISAGIDTCETRYPCSVIEHILLQPVDLQGPDVDRVSRATESADAYYWGLVNALANAETGTFRSARP
jgi:uncharacterized protein with FMN-binding domain